MNTLTILLGGNSSNSKELFIEAESMLSKQIGCISQSSALFESEPWGFESEQWFVNKVLQFHTSISSAYNALSICLDIEKQLGRVRTQNKGYSSRPIDIDILFFNSEIIDSHTLIIPHPRLHLRKFTLMPLCDVMPTFIHPTLNKSIETILKDCTDNTLCRKLE